MQAIDVQTELVLAIENTYELNRQQWPGLRCHQNPIVQESDLAIPEFGELVSISKMGPDLTWEFTIPEEYEDVLSISSSRRTLPSIEQVKLRHDFVSEILHSGPTDMKLKDTFNVQGDEDDILTPDFIKVTESGVIHVFEVATSRSPRVQSLCDDFESKKFKYEGPLVARSTNKIVTYTPIVVGQRCVVSNIQLPKRLIFELLVRMSISIAIENDAAVKGISLDLDEKMSKATVMGAQILDTIKEIQFKEPPKGSFISISKPYYESVLQEPNESFCKRTFALCKAIAFDEVDKNPNHDAQMSDFVTKLSSESNKRFDLKPVCGFPLIDPVTTDPQSKPVYSTFPNQKGRDCLPRIWGHAMSSLSTLNKWKNEDSNALLREAYSSDKKKVTNSEEVRHKFYRDTYRVNMKEVLDIRTKNYLSKDGLFGKQFKRDPFHKTRVLYQKQSFNWATDTEDINRFISDMSLFEKSAYSTPKSLTNPLELINFAEEIAGNERIGKDTLLDWCNTKIFRSMDFLSDLGMELSISLKQNTRQHEMILKKLKNYNVNLLIKTTNSDSHIFYSLMLPCDFTTEGLHNTVFKKFIQSGRNRVTEFSSFNKDKLGNIINASSRLLTLIAFWADFYGLPDLSVQTFKSHKSACKMLLLSMLISLENKAETEESITLSRYMYMEIFKMNVTTRKPDPFKVLSKFNTKPRSRLNLWVMKSIACRFKTMVNIPPSRKHVNENQPLEDGEDSLPGDEWNHLLNIFTGELINTSTAAVNLMYLGYLKDKNEMGHKNSEWGLVEKIVEEEMQIKDFTNPGHYGEVDSDQLPGKKMFSKECIMFGSFLMERHLKSLLGKEWKKVITIEIRDSLARNLTHEIATLKASADINHRDVKLKLSKKDTESTKRIKVIEAIATKLGLFGLNPMLNLKRILNHVEDTSNGVICDLFKKQQHGGLREIYVLTIESRILQLFIETIARTLCSYFEEETLTHPYNKLKILDQHKMRSARIGRSRNSIFADFCSSSDKTRWNQNFVMTAMCIPLVRLTEDFFHPAIVRCLNLWSTKYIKLPPGVCALLSSGTLLSSPAYRDLLLKFENRTNSWSSQPMLSKHGSPYLRTTSGMMQGILHYLSSLVHMTFLYASKTMVMSYLKNRYSRHGFKFTMSSVCSSDDSATILSCFTDKDLMSFGQLELSVFMDSESSLQCLTHFCRFFCMLESTKSTIGLYDYIEFNSEFLFKNTLVMPTIKFVAACLNISESESFSQRFHEMYNLFSNISSSGLPSLNSYFCQLAQAFMHYKIIGSSTSGLFAHYKEKIMEYPDPVHGFFCLDSELIPGLLGFSWCYWNLIRSSPEILQSRKLLNYSELESTPEGVIIDSLSIKHGDLYRWKKLMSRIYEGKVNVSTQIGSSKNDSSYSRRLITKDEKIVSIVEKNPELLFRHPNNELELRHKLLLKASMPGVSKSLSRGNPLTQAVTSSAYILFSHCFTRTTVLSSVLSDSKGRKRVKKTEKLSLLLSLKQRIDQSKSISWEDEFDDLMRSTFPLHDRYLDASHIITEFSNANLKPIHSLRQTKSIIRILPTEARLPLNMLQVCSKLWFGFSQKCSNNMFIRCLNHYKSVFPWIEDTIEDTLKISPFQNYVELHSFISGQSQTSRTVHRNGPAIRGTTFRIQLCQIIRRSFLRNHLLMRDVPHLKKHSKTIPFRTQVSLALSIPFPKERDRQVREVFTQICKQVKRPQEWLESSHRDFSLAMLASFYLGIIKKSELQDLMRSRGCGTILAFSRPQDKEIINGKIHWTGSGECIAIVDGITMRIQLEGKEARRIYIKDPHRIKNSPGILRELFDSLKCRPSTSRSFEIRCAFRFDGVRYQYHKGQGTPIISDPELEATSFETEDCEFKIGLNHCSIQVDLGGRKIPILKFQGSIVDLDVTSEVTQSVNPWSCWVNCQTLVSAQALLFIDNINEIVKRKGPNDAIAKDVSTWAKETLNKRVTHLGVGYSGLFYGESVASSLLYEVDPSEEDDLDWFYDAVQEGVDSAPTTIFQEAGSRFIEAMKDIVSYENNDIEEVEKIGEVGTMEDLLGVESAYNVLNSILGNWTTEATENSRTVHSYNLKNGMFLHPFWDSFINEIHRADPKFFSKTLQGVVSNSDPDLSRKLMMLLNIKEVHKELNITERLFRLSGFHQDSTLSDAISRNSDDWY